MGGLQGIEWVRLAPDQAVIATVDRAWLHQLNPAESDNFFASLSALPVKAGDPSVVRNLLDGVIVAAKSAVSAAPQPPALSRLRLVWRLSGLYHLCHSTEQLMTEAAQRFAVAGYERLAQWAKQKAKEEVGHDRLALLDIQSIGFDAEAVVNTLAPPVAVTLVDYFTRSVQDPNPVGCIGYTYTMERLALGVGQEYIQRVEALLPPNVQATRCLRVHSRLGSDLAHVSEAIEVVAGLSCEERVRVAIACYETALLCFSSPQAGHMSDEALQTALGPLELQAIGERCLSFSR